MLFPLRVTAASRRVPVLTIALVLANVVVFWHEANLRDFEYLPFFSRYGVTPARMFPLSLASLFPVFTSMFIHLGWEHLVGNMWLLWIFGDDVENRMGRVQFLMFYLVSGLAAIVAHVVSNPTSARFCVGASGALSGVMGAYFFMFPTSTVTSLIWTPLPRQIEVPAALFLGLWVLGQVGSALAGRQYGVAWYAHLGGFAAGFLVALAARAMKGDEDEEPVGVRLRQAR